MHSVQAFRDFNRGCFDNFLASIPKMQEEMSEASFFDQE